jgi:hypothetical protein
MTSSVAPSTRERTDHLRRSKPIPFSSCRLWQFARAAPHIPSLRMELRNLGGEFHWRNAVPSKFWLTSARELRRLGAKGRRLAMSLRVSLSLYGGVLRRRMGLVPVQGLGLDQTIPQPWQPGQKARFAIL